MAWFQVMCPQCTAALQVKLPEGVTTVECSQCKSTFGVQVQATAMPSHASAAESKSSRRSRAPCSSKEARGSRRTEAMKLYNEFMKEEIPRLRHEHPELASKEHHTTVFRMAAHNWAAARTNPKNATAGNDAVDSGSDSGLDEERAEPRDDDAAMDTSEDAEAASPPPRRHTRANGKKVARRA